MARGTEIDLGGTKMRLRVDWEAIEQLETQWGSIKAWGTALNQGAQGPMFRAVGDGVAACVRDLPVPARTLMDLGRFAEYAEALQAALMESGLWTEDVDQGNPSGPTTAPSPGSNSSTSMSSAGDSVPSNGSA